MTKFKFLQRFANHDELTKWQIANQFSWGTTNSCLIKCTICPAATHKMRNVIASCTNKDCNQGDSCPKRYKICICQRVTSGQVTLHEDGEHRGHEFKFKAHGISANVKDLIEDLIDRHDNQPKLIHIKLTTKKWRSNKSFTILKEMFRILFKAYF